MRSKSFSFKMLFAVSLSVLCTCMAMEGSPVRKKVQEMTFDDMFLSNLQRHLHRGDMEAALEAVHEHEQASVMYPGERNRKAVLGKHFEDEEMTVEAFRLPTFDSLKEAKKAFKDTPEASRRKKEKVAKLKNRVDSLLYQKKRIMGMIETVMSKKMTKENVAILASLEKLKESNKKNGLEALEQLREAVNDINKREKFIDEHPKMFLKKKYWADDQYGLKRAKMRIKKLGDGQVIRIDDGFSKTMPESLKLKCVNARLFTNVPEVKAETHGIAVASIAVDTKIGVAPNAKFRAAEYFNDFPVVEGPFKENPAGLSVIPLEGVSLGKYAVKVLEIYLRNDQSKIACLVNDEYYTIDTTSINSCSEQIINISSNYWDHIQRDRSRNPNRRLPRLLAFAALIHTWIKQGKVIVWAAGNEGTTVGASSAYTILRTFSEAYPKVFLVALSVAADHTSLSDFTNQPGNHPINSVSLCAPGEEVDVMNLDGTYRKSSGTSYSAPFIAGAAALLASNFPKATGPQIISALLDSATPVVMRKSPNRRYESPYALRDIRSKNLIPGEYLYLKADGKRLVKIVVTQEMIQKGREKYGVGIINVSGAMKALEKIYGPIKI